MANIITAPESGIYFDGNTAGVADIPTLTGNASGVAIQYDGYAGIEINSSATGVNYLDRFSVEGSNGRLFGVSDAVTGTVFSVNDAAGLPIVEVESTADYDKITIGEYGTDALVVSGDNVGIGTDSPSVGLQVGNSVNGETKTVIFNSEGGAENGLLIKSRTNRAKLSVADNDTTAYMIAEGSVASFGMADTAAGTNISVKADGNVGIGTTSPSSILETSSNGSLITVKQSVSGSTFNGVQFKAYSGGINGGLIWNQSTGEIRLNAASSYFPTFYSSGSERMRINSSGNVGVGTADPKSILELASNNPVINFKDTNAGTDQSYRYIQNVDGKFLFAKANDAYNSFTTHMAIDTDGNVGIGTTSPTTVGGTAKLTIDVGATTNVPVTIANGTTDALYIRRHASSGKYQLQTTVGASNIGDLALQGYGGNVGIGEVNPTTKLYVAGTFKATGDATFSSNLTLTGANKPTFTTPDDTVYTPSYNWVTATPFNAAWHDLIAFDRNYTTTQEISTDGTNFSSDTLELGLFDQQDKTSYGVIGNGERAVRWTWTGVAYNVGRYFHIAAGYSSPAPTCTVKIETSSDGSTWTEIHSSSGITFSATNRFYYVNPYVGYGGDNYVRLTIDKGNTDTKTVNLTSIKMLSQRLGDQGKGREDELPFYYDKNQNIGIGTTAPDSLLEIENAPAAQTQTRMLHLDNNPSGNQGSGYIQISSGTNNQATTQIEQVSSGGFGLLGNQYLDTNIINKGLSASAHGNINFATGSSTSATSIVMTIGGGSQKGNVGIGTTSPAAKLHIADATDINMSSTGSGQFAILGNGYTAAMTMDNTALYLYHNSSSRNLVLGTNETARLTIKGSNGNVGIGTISPSQKLHIEGVTYSTLGFKVSNGYSIGALGYNSALRFNNGNILVNNSSAAEFARFDATNSRVGIKTTTPAKELDVVGTVRAVNSGDQQYQLRPTQLITYNVDAILNAQSAGDDVILKTQGNTRLIATAEGNVGIGDATPSYKLDVNGTLRAAGAAYFNGSVEIGSSLNMTDGDITSAYNIYGNYFRQRAHGIPRNNLGDPTVTEMALFEPQFTCKTDLSNNYNDLSDLKLYVQPTSSEAWAEVTSYSDDNKRKFLRTNNSSIIIPNLSYKYRVEFNAKNYTFANALYMYWSSNSHNTQVHIWKQRASDDTWIQHTSSTATVSSWPGHLWLPFSSIPWLEDASSTSTGHYHKIRIEFTPNWSGHATYGDRDINLYGGQIWGGYPSGRRTPHYYDQNGLLNTWGAFNISTIAAATSDLDKFLVSDSGTVKYRTGAQVLSDIGGLSTAGGTITGDILLGDYNKISGVTTDNLVIGVDKNNASGGSSIDFQLDGSTSALFINNSRNVGIGTTSPAEKLEVNGSVRVGNVKIQNANGGRIGLNRNTSTGAIYDNSLGAFQIQNNSSIGLEIQGYNTSGAFTGSISMSPSNGNVGINDNSPSYKLDVNGTLRAVGAATFDSNVTVAGNLTVNGTTTTINSTTVTVDDKNIELGSVASPTDTTADGGGITLKGATDKTINWLDASSAWTFSDRIAIPDGTNAAPALTFANDTDTGIRRPTSDVLTIVTGGATRANISAAGIESLGNVYSSSNGSFRNTGSTWKATTAVTGHGFEFSNSVDGTALTISSTGDVVASGSVKTEGPDGGMVMRTWQGNSSYGMIGTANMANDEYCLLTDGVYTFLSAGTDGYVTIRGGNNDTSPNIRVSTTDIRYIGLPNNGSEATALVIDGNNAVGYRELGSNAFNSTSYLPLSGGSMTGSLQVATTGATGINIKADTGNSNISGRLFFSNQTAGEGVSIYNGDNKMMFQTGATFNSSTGSTRMTILASGNVGIGTTSPSEKLELTGYAKASSGFKAGSYTIINESANESSFGNSAYYGLLLKTNNATRMKITNAGNVGIGTTSPSYKLTTYGSADSFPIVAGAPLATSDFVGIGLSGFIASNGAVKAGIALQRVGNYGTGDIHFLNNSTEDNNDATLADSKLVIKENGNVGIGTTSPDYRLDIGGDTASSSNTLRMVQANGGTAIRVGAGGGSNDVTLLRVDGNSTNFKGESDSGNFGFSLRYKGSGSGNGNSLAFFSDNQTASQVEALTIMQDGSVGIGAATPLGKLHIYQSNNNEDALVLKGGGDSGSVQGECSLSMSHFSSDSNPAVRITTQEIDNGDYRANLLFFVRGVNSNSEPTEKMRITYTGDAEITTASKGLILKSPNGSRFRIVVNDSGELSTTSV